MTSCVTFRHVLTVRPRILVLVVIARELCARTGNTKRYNNRIPSSWILPLVRNMLSGVISCPRSPSQRIKYPWARNLLELVPEVRGI